MARFFRAEQLFLCSLGACLWAALRVVFAPGRPYFWVTPKTRDIGQPTLVLYVLSGFLPLALLGATAWVIVRHLTWPAMATFCRLNSLVTLAWELRFLLCLFPFVSLLVVPPRLCTEYFSDSLAERPHRLGPLLRWLPLLTRRPR